MKAAPAWTMKSICKQRLQAVDRNWRRTAYRFLLAANAGEYGREAGKTTLSAEIYRLATRLRKMMQLTT